MGALGTYTRDVGCLPPTWNAATSTVADVDRPAGRSASRRIGGTVHSLSGRAALDVVHVTRKVELLHNSCSKTRTRKRESV